MKSRKNLKKEIKKAFNILYKDILFYEAFVVNANKDAARAILDKTIATEEELMKRVSFTEGKEVKGRVKMYFSKLRTDLSAKINEIAKEIAAL